MPINLTAADLAQAQALLNQGQISAMYTYLAERGDSYAMLANGVATGNTLSGAAAIEFMRNTAAQQGKTLSDADINTIRREMADGYLATLQTIAGNESTNGSVTRQISFNEAQQFHNTVFNDRQLGPDAWTLNTPGILFGPDGAQQYWERLLGAAGSGWDEALIAGSTLQWVDHMREFMQPQYRDMAASWSARFPKLSWAEIVQAASQDEIQWAVEFFNRAMRELWDAVPNVIDPLGVNTTFRSSLAPLRPRDPLAIDLDGDGIETVGISGLSPILFDHNADGIRTGTGWLAADDAWLALDRDGSGSIDTGRELFGVDTLLSGTPGVDAVYAASGFAALATLDANADAVFNASDAAFGQVRLWRDLNQDGVSQSNELSTLAQQGIASISLSASSTNINLGNGNTLTGSATVTRSSGGTTQAGTVAIGADSTAGNLNLANNPFYREFTTAVSLSAAALALPEMGGSGWVRDLREAMSLGTSQAAALAAGVQQLAAAGTRDAQLAVLDGVLRAWAETNQTQPPQAVDDPHRVFNVVGNPALSAQLQWAVPILEVFNGATVEQSGIAPPTVTTGGDGLPVSTYTIAAQQASLMMAAYAGLRESLYGAIVVQTRLAPYLNAIELVIDETGIRFDTMALTSMLNATRAGSEQTGSEDLVELIKYSGSTLDAVGFDSEATLRPWVEALPVDSPLQALLGELNVTTIASLTATAGTDIYFGNTSANSFLASGGADRLYGGGGDDRLYGQDGDDLLQGGAGSDYVSGGQGEDNLAGGTGDDTLVDMSLTSNDTYRYQLGDGTDLVLDDGGFDTVQLGAGITAANTIVRALQNGSIDFTFADGGRLSLWNQHPLTPNSDVSAHVLEQVAFADGTLWDLAQIRQQAVTGTAGADTIQGFIYDDDMAGGDGNDTLLGGAGNDTIDGGLGVDTLDGGDGDVVLVNGETLSGGTGSDTYVLNSWQAVTVTEALDAASNIDALVLPAGISPESVRVLRTLNTTWGGYDDLSLKDLYTGIEVKLPRYFNARERQVEEFRFADGTVWTWADVSARDPLHAASYGSDQLYGYAWSDNISGAAGNDTIFAQGASDTLAGDEGDDTLVANLGADTLLGGAGNDQLYGDDISSTTASDGNDVLDGGAGDDLLYGRGGNDTYVFGRGSGSDLVFETAGVDTVALASGVAQADVTLFRMGNDLIVALDQGPTQLRIAGHFGAASGAVESISFADGSSWDSAAIALRAVSGTQNAMTGTAGNDTFVVDHVGDSISEGVNQGIDTVQSSVGYALGANLENLTLTGYLNVFANGNDLDNVITGNAGNNALYGEGGTDTLAGGLGDDFYRVNGYYSWNTTEYESNDTVVEAAGAGIDTVKTATYNYTLPVNVENLISTNNWGSMNGYSLEYIYRMLTGNALNNIIDSDRLSTFGARIDGGLGADTMRGGWGDDVYVVDNVGDLVDERGWTLIGQNISTKDTVESSVSFTLGAWLDNLKLTGSAATSGTGNDLNNVLDGSANSAGNVLTGGWGNDTYRIGISDAVVEGAGQGNDTVYIAQGAIGTYAVASYSNIENIALDDALGSSGLQGDSSDNKVTGNRANNTLSGGDGNDLVVDGPGYLRDAAGHVLLTQNDADQLYGGNGADQLVSNYGADLLDGGAGNDELSSGGAGVTVAFGQGYGGDRWTAYVASPTNRVRFNSDVDISDLQVGRVGADLQLTVGSGDTLTVANSFVDASSLTSTGLLGFVEFADGGRLTQAQLVSRLVSDNTNLATAAGDTLIGTATADALSGLGGDDALFGGLGDDTLAGNQGADSVNGGSGNDRYLFARGDGQDTIVDAAGAIDSLAFASDILPADVVVRQSGGDLQFSISGTTDQVTISGFFNSAAAQVERVEFVNGTVWDAATLIDMASRIDGTPAGEYLAGTPGADRIFGYGGDDTLQGLDGNDTLDAGEGNDSLFGDAGADTLIGGLGDDQYFFPDATDVILEASGAGFDTVYSQTSYTLNAANVEALVLSTSANVDGTGNSENNAITGGDGINRLDGGAGDDILVGGLGNDTLIGGIGNDSLDGGAGNDSMAGGVGNDTYYLNVSTDVVTEQLNEGTDTAIAGFTHTLASNVENLTLTGTNAINGTGNGLDNALAGNSAANVLTGGAGNDTYVVTTGDTTTEAANAGTDTVLASVTWTLATNLENLTLTGAANINATGNTVANVITGNAGNNAINGGTGADTMLGGAGNDTYVVNVATDVVTELADEGIDTIQSSATLTLGNNVENLTLTGTSTLSGMGNALDNLLIGTSGNNTLTGLAGNDTLDGLAGTDTMVGGLGDDIYVVERTADVVTEGVNAGTDTIRTSVTLATLAANVENLMLLGSAALNATGNALNNVLIGNSGINVLTGAAGDDSYDGAAGNDTFTDNSTTSNDSYRWGSGSGLDTLTDSGGALDHVDLFAGISSSQLRFAHVGNNLELSIAGNTLDKLTMNGWYASAANQIEEFRLSDGSVILASQVDSLIAAMATFGAAASAGATGPSMTIQPVRTGSELTMPAIA